MKGVTDASYAGLARDAFLAERRRFSHTVRMRIAMRITSPRVPNTAPTAFPFFQNDGLGERGPKPEVLAAGFSDDVERLEARPLADDTGVGIKSEVVFAPRFTSTEVEVPCTAVALVLNTADPPVGVEGVVLVVPCTSVLASEVWVPEVICSELDSKVSDDAGADLFKVSDGEEVLVRWLDGDSFVVENEGIKVPGGNVQITSSGSQVGVAGSAGDVGMSVNRSSFGIAMDPEGLKFQVYM